MNSETSNLVESKTTSYDFPDELLAEILKRVPVKSLLRFRCVKKSWNCLIQSSYFIKLQLSYQQKSALLLFKTNESPTLSLRFDNEACQEYCKLELLPNLNLPRYLDWYSTCYGLICVSTMFVACKDIVYRGDIYLWNPLIQKAITLPDQPHVPVSCLSDLFWACLAFVFLPEINDYVVIKMENYRCCCEDKRLTMICIYSLNSNSWRCIGQYYDTTEYTDPYDWVFVNGAAFWRGYTTKRVQMLLCFDTKNDVLRQIPLPQIQIRNDVVQQTSLSQIPEVEGSLYQFGESVAFFVEDVNSNAFSMYVLIEASINEFVWEKKITVDLDDNIKPQIFGIRNNGEILLSKDNKCGLISYNIDKDEPKDFFDSWDRWDSLAVDDADEDSPTLSTIYPFLETLTLLDRH